MVRESLASLLDWVFEQIFYFLPSSTKIASLLELLLSWACRSSALPIHPIFLSIVPPLPLLPRPGKRTTVAWSREQAGEGALPVGELPQEIRTRRRRSPRRRAPLWRSIQDAATTIVRAPGSEEPCLEIWESGWRRRAPQRGDRGGKRRIRHFFLFLRFCMQKFFTHICSRFFITFLFTIFDNFFMFIFLTSFLSWYFEVFLFRHFKNVF
jgi:hypothetical protein